MKYSDERDRRNAPVAMTTYSFDEKETSARGEDAEEREAQALAQRLERGAHDHGDRGDQERALDPPRDADADEVQEAREQERR
jgi:hypothetical protein